MKLTFVNARRVNPDKDGFDFQYFYTLNEEDTIHKIHVVTGSDGAELAWNISKEDLYEYSKKVFPLVINFMKLYWQKQHKLPDENHEYFEKRELGILEEAKADWKNFVLQLE